jgi:hypothetical protein
MVAFPRSLASIEACGYPIGHANTRKRESSMSADWWLTNWLSVLGIGLSLAIALYQSDISRWHDRYRQSRARTAKQRHVASLKRQVALVERLHANASATVAFFFVQQFFCFVYSLTILAIAGTLRTAQSQWWIFAFGVLAVTTSTFLWLTIAHLLQVAERLQNPEAFLSRYRAAISKAEAEP